MLELELFDQLHNIELEEEMLLQIAQQAIIDLKILRLNINILDFKEQKSQE